MTSRLHLLLKHENPLQEGSRAVKPLVGRLFFAAGSTTSILCVAGWAGVAVLMGDVLALKHQRKISLRGVRIPMKRCGDSDAMPITIGAKRRRSIYFGK
jgi:hypothetical protein